MDIIILYNPNSTGDSEQLATKLHDELEQGNLSHHFTVTLRATEYAGHAEEIAASHARSGKPCTIISSSGDGGYHEVINGAVSHEKSRVITGVLPAGNANDHHNAVGNDTQSLIDSILHENHHTIDLLRVNGTVNGKPWTRYAHSYAGIGIVARAAKDLTKKRPNAAQEKWLVAKSLVSFRYVKIIENGSKHRYSSLIFSNIAIMSKVLKLADSASLTDGKFEVNRIRFHSKLRLLLYLITAAIIGLKPTESVSHYTFTTIKPTDIQLDGEVYTIDADCLVTIESAQKRLRYVQ